MKKLCLWVLFAITALSAAANPQLYQAKNWQEAKYVAHSRDKFILTLVTASWCGPCDQMIDALQSKELHEKLGERYIMLVLDKKDAPQQVPGFQPLDAFPTLVISAPDGHLAGRLEGTQSAQEIVAAASEALETRNDLQMLRQRFQSGERDERFAMHYFHRLDQAGLPNEEAVLQYFADLPKQAYRNPYNWEIFRRYYPRANDSVVAYILKYRQAFYAQFSEDIVNRTLRQKFEEQMMQQVIRGDYLNLAKIESLLMASNLPGAQRLKLEVEIEEAIYLSDWDFFAEKALELSDRFLLTNPNQLHRLAWYAQQHGKGRPQLLESATIWAKRAYSFEQNYRHLLLVSRLKERTGNPEKARQLALAALKKAKSEGKTLEELQPEFAGMF